MICLKAHDKSSNVCRKQLHSNCVVTLLPKSCYIIPACYYTWLLNDLRIDFKRICYYLIQSLVNRVHICIYTAWVGRRDLPLQGLSCCLVKHFNISGSEVDTGSTCIKSTGRVICRVPMGERVGVATTSVGIAVACSVVGYVQVVCSTKGWSVSGTRVYSGTVTT